MSKMQASAKVFILAWKNISIPEDITSSTACVPRCSLCTMYKAAFGGP